jgi:hypothetical protein
MKANGSTNPRLTEPKQPSMQRRAFHHDYRRPARYLITIAKSPAIPPLASILGDPRCTDPSEAAIPHSTPLPPGNAINEALLRWQGKFPQITVDSNIIMPDHLHLCVRVTANLPHGLSLAIAGFKGLCTRIYHNTLPSRQRPGTPLPLFAKGFNDSIAYNDDQYRRQLKYVADNPRRLLLKRLHPDLFFRKWEITLGDLRLTASGNIFLLHSPRLINVRFSRRYTPQQWHDLKEQYLAVIYDHVTLISPFIHPEEKAIRDEAIAQGAGIIRICDNGFSDRFAPQGLEFDLAGSSRLLLIAPGPHDTRCHPLTYRTAQTLNTIALTLATLPPSTARFRPVPTTSTPSRPTPSRPE